MGFLLSDIRVLLLIAVVLAGGFAVFSHQRAERYQTERDAARNENVRLIEAIESKEAILTDLTSALQVWQERATQSVQESTEAAERAQTYQTQLSAARGRIRALTEADRALPECQSLLAVDLAGACPGNTERVRQWAAGDLQGPADTGANARDPAARPETH